MSAFSLHYILCNETIFAGSCATPTAPHAIDLAVGPQGHASEPR